MIFGDENTFYYLIQNMDTALPDFFMTGNIPYLSKTETVRCLLFILALVLAFMLFYRHLKRISRKYDWSPVKLYIFRIILFINFFVILETVLNFPYFRAQCDFIPDPITFWSASLENVPDDMKKRVPNTKYRPRRLGIFDTDYAKIKSPDTYRILFMGDSQSISSGSQQYASLISYPKNTGMIIRKEGLVSADGRNVETINGGMSGFSSWQGRLFLDNKLINLEPDLIIEAFGYHDSNLAYSYDKEIISADPKIWKIRKILYSSRIYVFFRAIVLGWQASIIDSENSLSNPDDPKLQRVTPQDIKANLLHMANTASKHNAKIIFFIEPLPGENSLRFDNIIAAIIQAGKESNTPVINCNQLFRKMPAKQKKSLFCDNIHFTPEGHALIANIITERLMELGFIKKRSEKK